MDDVTATRAETRDELRARLDALVRRVRTHYWGTTDTQALCDAIDTLLARLAAAEAGAEKWRRRWEELASSGERHMWREHGVLPDKDVALRERSS